MTQVRPLDWHHCPPRSTVFSAHLNLRPIVSDPGESEGGGRPSFPAVVAVHACGLSLSFRQFPKVKSTQWSCSMKLMEQTRTEASILCTGTCLRIETEHPEDILMKTVDSEQCQRFRRRAAPPNAIDRSSECG